MMRCSSTLPIALLCCVTFAHEVLGQTQPPQQRVPAAHRSAFQAMTAVPSRIPHQATVEPSLSFGGSSTGVPSQMPPIGPRAPAPSGGTYDPGWASTAPQVGSIPSQTQPIPSPDGAPAASQSPTAEPAYRSLQSWNLAPLDSGAAAAVIFCQTEVGWCQFLNETPVNRGSPCHCEGVSGFTD